MGWLLNEFFRPCGPSGRRLNTLGVDGEDKRRGERNDSSFISFSLCWFRRERVHRSGVDTDGPGTGCDPSELFTLSKKTVLKFYGTSGDSKCPEVQGDPYYRLRWDKRLPWCYPGLYPFPISPVGGDDMDNHYHWSTLGTSHVSAARSDIQ